VISIAVSLKKRLQSSVWDTCIYGLHSNSQSIPSLFASDDN